MMFKRKLETPNVRMVSDLYVTAERKEFIEAVRASFCMCRSDVYMQGILALLEIKKDLLARIFMGDYVLLYRTKNRTITAVKRKGTEYVEMYVYKIEAITEDVCRVYYKDNGDIDDNEFKIWKCGRKKLHKTVFEEFPVCIGEVVPK